MVSWIKKELADVRGNAKWDFYKWGFLTLVAGGVSLRIGLHDLIAYSAIAFGLIGLIWQGIKVRRGKASSIPKESDRRDTLSRIQQWAESNRDFTATDRGFLEFAKEHAPEVLLGRWTKTPSILEGKEWAFLTDPELLAEMAATNRHILAYGPAPTIETFHVLHFHFANILARVQRLRSEGKTN